jgi:hypothetical protein
VQWNDATGCSSDVQFEGEGSTPLERRASMQRQLAALCSSTDFLAPDSWPTCSCLTSCTLHVATDAVFFRAATRTPSLAHLDICVNDASACTPLGDLSSLQRLSTLIMTSSYNSIPGTLNGEVLAAVGQLGSLRQLNIDLDLLDESDEDDEDDEGDAEGREGFAIPASWSALSSLTEVVFLVGAGCGLRLAAPQLSRLSSVEDLALDNAVVVGGVSSLFALTRMTSLVGPAEFEDGIGGEAGSSGALQAPQRWRDGLQRLTWRDYSKGSIAMLAQLTCLTFLHLKDACVSPELCRCESGASPAPHCSTYHGNHMCRSRHVKATSATGMCPLDHRTNNVLYWQLGCWRYQPPMVQEAWRVAQQFVAPCWWRCRVPGHLPHLASSLPVAVSCLCPARTRGLCTRLRG